MARKKKNKFLTYFIIFFVILIIVVTSYFTVFQTAFGEDETFRPIGESDVELTGPFGYTSFCYYDRSGAICDNYLTETKYWKLESPGGYSNVAINREQSNDFKVAFYTSDSQGQSSGVGLIAYSKANLKNKNFRMDWEAECQRDNTGYGGGNLRIQIGNLNSENFRVGTSATKGSVELIVDGGYEGKAEVRFNGRKQGVVDYSNIENVLLRFYLDCGGVMPRSGVNRLILEDPKYQLPYQQCILEGNDQILSYSYKKGETIRLTLNENYKSLLNGYEDKPIKWFCIGKPADLITKGEGGLRVSYTIYDEIREKGFQEVDKLAGTPEEVILYGVYDNPNGELTPCDEGFNRNARTLICETTEQIIPEPIGVSEGADFTYQSRWHEDDEEGWIADVPKLESGEFYFSPQVPGENSVTVNTNLGNFNFERGQEIQLTNYIKVKCLDIREEFLSNFEFTIDEDNGFSVDLVNTQAPKKSEPYALEFEFTNNLGTPIKAGVQYQIYDVTGQKIEDKLATFTKSVSIGNSIITKEKIFTKLGTFRIESIKPFIEFNSGNTIYKTSSSQLISKELIIGKGIIEEQEKILEEQAQRISDLTKDINEQAELIKELQLTYDEQGIIINNLNLNINQQSELIKQLTVKSEEQAQIINNLEINIQEKAELIKQLTSKSEEQANIINQLNFNLQEKAQLISQLTATNEEQANLIKQMRLSFAEQGQIIDALDLKISEDAQLISKLTSNNNEQGQIISNMNLVIKDDALLISQLTKNNDEQAVIIYNMKLTSQEQAELIKQLTDNLEEQKAIANKIKSLKKSFISQYWWIFLAGIIIIIVLILILTKKR